MISTFRLIALIALLCALAPVAHADGSLPIAVTAQLHMPVAEVGSGVYRKFGFSVYRATLWAPGGTWDDAKPYALSIRYMRGVDKDTLVDTVMDDVRDQNVADQETLAGWHKTLNGTLSDVKDGDTLVGVSRPGKPSLLFLNGAKIAEIDDPDFSAAFFNVWLGDQADESLRAKLLGEKQ